MPIYVDVPNHATLGDDDNSWISVATFSTKARALEFIRENIGPCDDDGNVCLIAGSGDEEESDESAQTETATTAAAAPAEVPVAFDIPFSSFDPRLYMTGPGWTAEMALALNPPPFVSGDYVYGVAGTFSGGTRIQFLVVIAVVVQNGRSPDPVLSEWLDVYGNPIGPLTVRRLHRTREGALNEVAHLTALDETRLEAERKFVEASRYIPVLAVRPEPEPLPSQVLPPAGRWIDFETK